MQRAHAGGPKVEPLADWSSDVVFSPAPRACGRGGFRVWRYAAALAACVGLAAVLLPSLRQPPQAPVLEYEATSQTREVLLPDGTHLILDVGTRVAYREERGDRRLDLGKGRVYLQVARKPGLPRFVVHSGDIDTTVLGTRFQVSRGFAGTEVVLEEGSVQVRSRNAGASATLAPGKRARWQATKGEFVLEPVSPAQAMAWTRGRLLFENATLAEAVAEVNRYATGVRLELADERAASLRISGSFVAGDAELVAASWVATLPLRAQHHGDHITLSHR